MSGCREQELRGRRLGLAAVAQCDRSGRYYLARQCDAKEVCYCVTPFGIEIPATEGPKSELSLEECVARRLDYVVPRLVGS